MLRVSFKAAPFVSTLLCCVVAASSLSFIPACGGVDCTLKLNDIVEEVDIHTELQADYLSGHYADISKYANGADELSKPNPLKLSWQATASDGNAPKGLDTYTVELALDQEFTDARTFETTDTFVKVSNLYLGAEYYWRVTADFTSGKSVTSTVSMFLTADAVPRNINVDGVTNMRDLGGWLGEDGPIKQGLIYRCGRLNDNYSTTASISRSGIKMMTRTLGIKSEVDLRRTDNNENGGIKSSPLGASVKYVSLPIGWSTVGALGQGGYLSERQEGYEDNRKSVVKFFEFASNKSNYPLIYHCSIGTDRTGMMTYFFLGLLGVSEDDIYTDYCFSNFGKIGGKRDLKDIQNGYIADINKCEGSSLSEKIKNYLVSIGVKEEHIEGVKNILKCD